MKSNETLATRARRLAGEDHGDQAFIKQMVKDVEAADDENLGLMVVACAVLGYAKEVRAQEVAKAKAAEQARVEAERRRAAAERNAAVTRLRGTRRRRLSEQAGPRLVPSALYALIIGVWVTNATGGGRFLEASLSILAVCVATVAASLLFDWFAFSEGTGMRVHSPEGRPRRYTVAGGVMLGLVPWLPMLPEGDFYGLGTVIALGPLLTYSVFATLPVMIASSWILGGMVSLAVGTDARPVQGARIRKAQKYLVPLSWLGVISAASALLFYNVEELASWLWNVIGSPAIIPQWNPWGVWDHPNVLIVTGVLAMVLHVSARNLTGRAVWLGYTACVLGPALGIASLFVNPGNVVTWLLDWAIRSAL